MKNTQTLGLLLGTTCLATIAMTQVTRPGDAPNQERQPPAAGQQNADSLKMVQQRLQQAVTSEVRSCAMKHDVKIDESSVVISLFGGEMIAGAPASNPNSKGGTSTGLDSQRKPGDPTPTTGTTRDQTQLGTKTSSENVLGIVLFSRELAPTGAMGRTPGAAGGKSDADGAQDPQNRDRAAAGQGAKGSNELVSFEVRRSQMGQNVELVDNNGQVALQVQLLGAANAAGRTREASSPREDRKDGEGREGREDATVGGGDPLGDPQSKDRARTGNPSQGGMDAANTDSADWNVVYASVVNQVCSKHHGKK